MLLAHQALRISQLLTEDGLVQFIEVGGPIWLPLRVGTAYGNKALEYSGNETFPAVGFKIPIFSSMYLYIEYDILGRLVRVPCILFRAPLDKVPCDIPNVMRAYTQCLQAGLEAASNTTCNKNAFP